MNGHNYRTDPSTAQFPGLSQFPWALESGGGGFQTLDETFVP